MRLSLRWTLVLHLLHCPIPFPDLDGECRGTPIASLAEFHAWHVMMLGVRPNDDIDRGPIRTTDEPTESAPEQSAFGSPAIVRAAPAPPQPSAESSISSPNLAICILRNEVATLRHARCDHKLVLPVSRAARVCFCSWQI